MRRLMREDHDRKVCNMCIYLVFCLIFFRCVHTRKTTRVMMLSVCRFVDGVLRADE